MGLQFFHSTFPDFLCVMSKKALRFTACITIYGSHYTLYCTVRSWQIFCSQWGRANSEDTNQLLYHVLLIMNSLMIEVCPFIVPTMLIILYNSVHVITNYWRSLSVTNTVLKRFNWISYHTMPLKQFLGIGWAFTWAWSIQFTS